MNANRLRIAFLFVLLQVSFLSSCVLDSKPMGYCVKNCTKETLLVNLTESDTLDSEMYWDKYSKDSILISTDTTSIYINGKKNVIFNYYCVEPETMSRGYFLINSDTFYLYAVKWSIVKAYTLEEIRKKKLYDRRVVRKMDFGYNRIFEYR